MTKQDEGAYPGHDWVQAQTRFWESWMDMSRRAFEQAGSVPTGTTTNPWNQALEGWWNAVGQMTGGGANADVTGKLMEQSKAFYQFGDGLMRLLREVEETAKRGRDWREQFNRSFDQIRDLFFSATPGAKPGGGDSLWAFWGLPADTWRRLASSLSGAPGDWVQGLKDEGVSHLHAGMERYLSLPAVGYTREWQEELQRGARLWMDYQKAASGYAETLAKVGSDAFEGLRARLEDMSEAGEKVENLRALYDLWVDCSEDAYADRASSQEFAAAQAKMTNALIAWKHHNQKMTEEWIGATGLPTKRELDTAHRRLHRMRREVADLRATVEELRKRVDAGPGGQSGGGSGSGGKSARPATSGKPAKSNPEA